MIDQDDDGKFWVGFAGPFNTREEALAFADVAHP